MSGMEELVETKVGEERKAKVREKVLEVQGVRVELKRKEVVLLKKQLKIQKNICKCHTELFDIGNRYLELEEVDNLEEAFEKIFEQKEKLYYLPKKELHTVKKEVKRVRCEEKAVKMTLLDLKTEAEAELKEIEVEEEIFKKLKERGI